MWMENGELRSIFRAHQRRTHINCPSFVANNPDPLAAIWPNISPCSYFLCPFVLRIMNMAHCEKNERVKIEKCASFIIEIVHFLLLSERATCRFYWFCGASCWVALQGVFFFSCRFYFLMIELVMSLSLQAIVTPFFFFKVPLKKTSPSPIYYFQCSSFKILM